MLRQQQQEVAAGTATSQLRISDERIKNELLTFMFAGRSPVSPCVCPSRSH
jgi:hypothetical protein